MRGPGFKSRALLAFSTSAAAVFALGSALADPGDHFPDRPDHDPPVRPAPAPPAPDPAVQTVSAVADVPRGVYVFSDNPPCGVDAPSLANLGDNPAAVSAVEAAFGPYAAAAVVFVSEANRILQDCGGGDICKNLRNAAGIRDHSSCAALCVETPPGASLVGVDLSNRHGAAEIRRSGNDALHALASTSTGDWSGWNDVIAVRDQRGGFLICGTATNWSGDQAARKVLTARYLPG